MHVGVTSNKITNFKGILINVCGEMGELFPVKTKSFKGVGMLGKNDVTWAKCCKTKCRVNVPPKLSVLFLRSAIKIIFRKGV